MRRLLTILDAMLLERLRELLEDEPPPDAPTTTYPLQRCAVCGRWAEVTELVDLECVNCRH